MAEKRERKIRTITANVASFEELVPVKKSIYPWDTLKSGEGNFFVACEDLEEARSLKGSIRASGQNYYMKRKNQLVPIVIVAQMKDGSVGVLASAIVAE